MQKTKVVLGVLAVTAGLIMQSHICRGTSWEGADDFSTGTLAKWDTTFMHTNPPNDGLFLTAGHMQFVRAVTSASYASSGTSLWSQSLPLYTNWIVLVDAHLKPSSVKTQSSQQEQDIKAGLYLVDSFPPNEKNMVRSVLENGSTNDVMALDGPDIPVVGAGWDFTLGISYDSKTKIATSLYYPTNQPLQTVVMTPNCHYVGGWTTLRIAISGLSQYWTVGPGEVWFDNFRLSGVSDLPNATMLKTVKPSFSNLILGRSYQVQVAGKLNAWTNQGTPFTATNTSMVYPQYWDVNNWGELFFRLQVAP